MNTLIERIPIILGDDLLAKDSIEASSSMDALFDEINNYNVSEKDHIHMLEDAFVMKFPSLWALKYKTIKGKPTTFVSKKNPFKHRPWQQGILDDQHPNKVVEKSRQLGISELSVTECLHFLTVHDNTKIMYTFPTYHQMNDFSTTRVAPVFRDSAYLKGVLSNEVNNVSTKKIRNSYLLMRSGSSGSIGEGADVDSTYFDEYDRMADGVELAFQEGLSSSKYGYIRRFSTPTIPGRGINAQYQKSDQMRYIHTCPHCGHKQFLTFEDNVIQINSKGVDPITHEIQDGTFIIGCKKCKKELDRWGIGEWVPMYPSIKETRGYHISQLDAAWISADAIMRRQYNYSSKQLFYNYVVGEPYANEGIMVTEEDVRASIRLPKESLGRSGQYIAVVAGIDWGATSYMVVLGIKANGAVDLMNIYKADENPSRPLNDVTQFCAILRTYQPNLVVADAGYGSDKNAYAYSQFPAVWHSCYWTTTKNATAKIKFLDDWNDTKHSVTVDKTIAVKRVLYSVKGHLIGMFPWNEKLQMLTLHLKNTRIMQEESEGLIYEVATRTGPDHTVSAFAYALVGVQKLTNYNVKFNQGLPYEFI